MPVYISKNNATLYDALEILKDAKKRFPVMHLSPFDKIVDGEGYVVSKQIDGTYSFKPNITRQGILFRGDSGYRANSADNAYYAQDEAQLQAKFINLIESFPLYRMFKRGVELPDGRIVKFENPYALAYAYGLKTPFVGLSSDLDVASFFAVARWDSDEQKFKVVTEGKGVLSSYELRQPLNQVRSLTALSLQVFRRTFRQKSYVLQIKDREAFYSLNAVTGFQFTHNSEISNEIFKKFEGGELLAPTDDILWTKWRKLRLSGNVNPCFTREDLKETYLHIEDYWRDFVGLINFVDNDNEAKAFLRGLPHEEPYARYFDLNRCWDER